MLPTDTVTVVFDFDSANFLETKRFGELRIRHESRVHRHIVQMFQRFFDMWFDEFEFQQRIGESRDTRSIGVGTVGFGRRVPQLSAKKTRHFVQMALYRLEWALHLLERLEVLLIDLLLFGD